MKGKLFNNESGGFRAGLYYLIFIAAFIVFSVPLQAVSKAAFGEESAYKTAVNCLAAPLALLFVVLAAKFLLADDVKVFLNGRFFSRTFTGLALILTFGMFFGLGFINYAFVDLLSLIGITVPEQSVIMNNARQYLLCAFTLCVIPAIAEELFFRGVLLSSLKNAGVISASVVSALFFAFYHCSPAQFFYQFVFGFFLALLAIKSNSVLPAVASHFLNNFAVLSCIFFKISINLYYLPYIALGIAFLFAFAFPVAFYKNEKREVKSGEIFSAFFPFGIIGILFCAASITALVLL